MDFISNSDEYERIQPQARANQGSVTKSNGSLERYRTVKDDHESAWQCAINEGREGDG